MRKENAKLKKKENSELKAFNQDCIKLTEDGVNYERSNL